MNKNKNKNKSHIDYALSAKDIKKIFKNKINILLYSDLEDYDTIEEVLEPHGQTMILYYWEAPDDRGNGSYYGHWCCVFYNGNGNVEFFNSFGGKIDDTLYQLGAEFRKQHNQYYKYLTKLLLDYNGDIEYNPKQLQAKIGTATCGRWCIFRMLNSGLDIKDFNKHFTHIKTNDKKITNLTNKLLL